MSANPVKPFFPAALGAATICWLLLVNRVEDTAKEAKGSMALYAAAPTDIREKG